MLWLFLWTAKNPASLPVSMDWLEPNNFACFYEKLGSLILCLFLGIHMYITLSYFYVWNSVFFCSKPWNPFLLCLEPCVFAWFYGLLGKNVLNLLLWKARNPVSLLVSMDCSESWFFAFFYGLLRTQLVYPLLWTLFPLCSEPWNPFPLCWESCVFACFYWLIGTQHLCLLLWKARNPDSLPVSRNSHVLDTLQKSWAAFLLETLRHIISTVQISHVLAA